MKRNTLRNRLRGIIYGEIIHTDPITLLPESFYWTRHFGDLRRHEGKAGSTKNFRNSRGWDLRRIHVAVTPHNIRKLIVFKVRNRAHYVLVARTFTRGYVLCRPRENRRTASETGRVCCRAQHLITRLRRYDDTSSTEPYC